MGVVSFVEPPMRLVRFLVVFLLVVLIPVLAFAQGAGDAQLRQARDRFATGDYGGALDVLRPLAAQRPDDARVLYLGGAALNRLGRHRQALVWLASAAAAGTPDFPTLDFELGWAATATGAWPVAIAHLSRYTASHPQDGKAHELLGRAYFADGQLDRAEASLAAALRADPSLRGTVRYYQASIANARGERAQANALLAEALRADPRSPLSLRILRQTEVPGAARPVAKPWNALVVLAAGYNDNVLLVDDSGLTLPTDVTTNETQALFAAVDTHYTFAGFGHDVVRLGYAGRFARYLDVSQGDYADNGVYGIYAHSVVPELEAAIRTGVSRTTVGGNTFRTAFELRPAVTWRATDYATVELALTRYEFDFEAQPTNVQRDRDSTQVAVGLNVSIVPPADVWQIRPRFGYARIDNDAVGSDYDFAADSVYIGINFTPGFDVTVDLLFAATNADYDHPNSFASNGTVLNAFERSDRTRSITLDVSKPILDDVDAFGTVAYRRNSSNIGLFEYHQHESVAGARIRF